MKRAIALIIALVFAVPVFAHSQNQQIQPQVQPLVVSTGDVKAGSTYVRLFNEVTRICNDVPLQMLESNGSVQNIQNLYDNNASLAFVQADVLFDQKLFKNKAEVDNIKTLMVMYPEEVHFVVRGDNRYIHSFNDFMNKKIVAWGGSYLTGLVLFGKTHVRPIEYVEVKNFDTAKALLDNAKIDGFIAVGGQPLGSIKGLSGNYRLVPFNRNVAEVADASYEPATLNYVNLNANGISTIATQTLLVTVDYKSKSKISSLTSLRNCIVNNLDDLRETTGNHPKWRLVDPQAKGRWPIYEPAFQKTTITVPTPKSKPIVR